MTLNSLDKNRVEKRLFVTITLPLLLWFCGMIGATSLPGDTIPPMTLFSWDKLLHSLMYFIFSILLFRYLFYIKFFQLHRAYLITFIIGVLYSILDELHQLVIPNRSCSLCDVGADVLGLVISLIVMKSIHFFKPFNRIPIQNVPDNH